MTATLTVRTGRWVALTSLTAASFEVRHLFGLRTVAGQVPLTSAVVDFPAADRPAAVSATLDLAAVDTGNGRRDRDLRKPHLLDSERVPSLCFSGTAVAGEDGWQVAGSLQHRCEAPVVLRDVQVRADESGALHVHAVTTFDRRDLGIRAPRFVIGRRIHVRIDATFQRA